MNDLQIIGESFNDNFTIVPNELLESCDLSPATRLFVIYCLSKPSNWVLRKTHVMKSLGLTDSMWRRAMKELKELTIIKIDKPRDPETNQFTEGTIYILDRDKIRDVKFHTSEKPQRGKPTRRENNDISNTESGSKTKKNKNTKGAYSKLIVDEYVRRGMPLDAMVRMVVDETVRDISSALDRKGLPNPYHMSLDDLKAMIAWLQEPVQSWVDFSASSFTSKAIRAKFATRKATPAPVPAKQRETIEPLRADASGNDYEDYLRQLET